MNEIILCNQTYNPSTFKNECGIGIEQISSLTCTKPKLITPNKPYLIKGRNTAIGVTTLAKLSQPAVTQDITNLSLSFGEDKLIVLSAITAQLQEYNVGLIGASTSVYANRISGFAGAVKNYQSALMEYRQATTTKSPLKVSAKLKAQAAFNKMQSSFKHEVNAVSNQVKSRRGTPLTNFKRGANIARSSRSIAKLDLINPVQADKLVQFTKHAKFLGNGLALIDFGSRAGNIHNSYKADDNWERELFIESSSFAASAITGTIAVDAGLALLIFATPVGWLGLVVGGLAVAGVAAGASMGMNNLIKSNAGNTYDLIMQKLNN